MFPANVRAARTGVTLHGKPATALWLRAPMQFLFIVLALVGLPLTQLPFTLEVAHPAYTKVDLKSDSQKVPSTQFPDSEKTGSVLIPSTALNIRIAPDSRTP